MKNDVRGVTRDTRQDIIRNPQKFVRYKKGAEMYCISQKTFEEWAHNAGAVYKINKIVLVNLDILDEYLENFRIV